MTLTPTPRRGPHPLSPSPLRGEGGRAPRHPAREFLNIGIPLPVAFAAVAAACAPADQAAAHGVRIDTLSDGTVAVHNPSRGLWSTHDRWTVEAQLRIGREAGEGPDVFEGIWAIATDGRDRIYVADRAAQVRVFEADGSYVRSIGRKGSGPGEFRWIAGMDFDREGRLWVVDYGNARYSVFDTSGAFVRSAPRRRTRLYVPWPGRFGSGGELYDVEGGGNGVYRLARLDENLNTVATFPLELFEGRNVPFAPESRWALDPGGDLWLGRTDRYLLYRRRIEGDTTRVVEREYRPIRISQSEKEAAVQGWRMRMGLTAQTAGGSTVGDVEPELPDTHWAFRQIWLDDRGDVWVLPTVQNDQGRVVDVFRSDGIYLGRLDLGFRIDEHVRPVFRDEDLYAVARDDNDVEYVVRARIVKPVPR